ncbi:arabinan endo-1,5-alpha-L-arabinosidase [Rhabdobacter roseus]|uniref:Arabinan endo-1,5-alpha-L-arabinosidase n=1 Tax=Rhabdobacter roseus TaxID=1655419 RepID=A0A840TSK5_9BACT|nr:arabinan endo-1,5-alpha-L-arabinosidase [Rhabdobacter roseus]MBB5284552.1 arabinan endo-1,5-alpha-L-arabinosidase [Rhabdobacter roseus]
MKKQLLLILLLGTFLRAEAQSPSVSIPVHDPVLIRQDSLYYLFCTGRGIGVWSSPDLKTWKREPPVFEEPPAWAEQAVPGFRRNHIWAPDISYHAGTYYLYYSISAFGKNTSCIGLATNVTLHPTDPAYRWTDHGKVLESVPGRDQWNAIDPNLIRDEAGAPWLAFGSFWDGLKLVKLTEDAKAIAQEPQQWYTLASRRRGLVPDSLPNNSAIEAPFIFKKANYYYLFASVDFCCRGEKSDYKMIVGRSEKLMGPYLDRQGRDLAKGGGTILLEGDTHWHGVGHNAVVTFEGLDYLVFHGYDAQDGGRSKLRIETLEWEQAQWPKVQGR